MRILYFYQYFTTPRGSWSTRVYEFTRSWVAQGHEVTVVTSVYSKSDIKGYGLVSSQIVDGVKLKVINARVDNKDNRVKRAVAFMKYLVISVWYALTAPCDVVIASSGPLTVAIPGIVAARIRRKRMVFEVRDIWPQNLVEMGMIESPLLERYLFALERKVYRNASHIITLSPDMESDIRRRFGYDNITTVPNQANIELFGTPVDNPQLGTLTGRKYALFVGNIGDKERSQWLLEVAEILKLRGRGDIAMVLIGDGPLKKELKARAVIEGTDNFIVMDMLPKVEVVQYLQNSIASIVSFKRLPILAMSSPNKFFESLAAGVPVIQTTKGWMNSYVEENGVGYNVETAKEIVSILINLADNPALVSEIGRRAQKAAVRDFNKDLLADRMLKVVIP